jgi:hypothetical protein
MSEFVLEMETFTAVSCNEITMKLRTTIDIGVLAEAGQVYFDLSVAADIGLKFPKSHAKIKFSKGSETFVHAETG